MKKAKIILKILQVVLSVACIIISAYCWYKSLELYNLYTVHPDNQLFSWMPPSICNLFEYLFIN